MWFLLVQNLKSELIQRVHSVPNEHDDDSGTSGKLHRTSSEEAATHPRLDEQSNLGY